MNANSNEIVKNWKITLEFFGLCNTFKDWRIHLAKCIAILYVFAYHTSTTLTVFPTLTYSTFSSMLCWPKIWKMSRTIVFAGCCSCCHPWRLLVSCIVELSSSLDNRDALTFNPLMDKMLAIHVRCISLFQLLVGSLTVRLLNRLLNRRTLNYGTNQSLWIVIILFSVLLKYLLTARFFCEAHSTCTCHLR